jgi:hypothetical protein
MFIKHVCVQYAAEPNLYYVHVWNVVWGSVSQPPGRGPLAGPGINYTGPREVLLEFVILVIQAFYMNKYFIVEMFWEE